ncbi:MULTISPECIES: helix-turn-helix transcriptional regulator [unclassified Streptomyces]|uniref:helix-turn-helix transcriptional regulator n=1 Tax=unclassified Streptomyces TaxID=2593676 RepID=UPI002E2AEA89|nr:helix-turn-helix transcriptional regulator [Streptomyces sp. NBC_01429]
MPTDTPAWEITRRREIGAALRDARHAANLSQIQLGELVGLDHKTIHRIEYALSDPSLGMLLRIARAVGVPLSDLIVEGGPCR